MHVLPIATFAVAILSAGLYTVLTVRARSKRGKSSAEWLGDLDAPASLRGPAPAPGPEHVTRGQQGSTGQVPAQRGKQLPDRKIYRVRPTKAPGIMSESGIRLGMQIAVSLVVLGGALYIIISQAYDAKDKHWAYGAVGTLLGFWLKS